MRPVRPLLALLPGLALLAAACGGTSSVAVPGGHASRGPAAVKAFGCGACHDVPGVAGADGEIGPSLAHLADRRTIAGRLPNTPAEVIRWIRSPQEISPGSLMPDLGVSETDARDIAAYLYRY
jgi:cytochrome c1